MLSGISVFGASCPHVFRVLHHRQHSSEPTFADATALPPGDQAHTTPAPHEDLKARTPRPQLSTCPLSPKTESCNQNSEEVPRHRDQMYPHLPRAPVPGHPGNTPHRCQPRFLPSANPADLQWKVLCEAPIWRPTREPPCCPRDKPSPVADTTPWDECWDRGKPQGCRRPREGL